MIPILRDIWGSRRQTAGLGSPSTGIIYHKILQLELELQSGSTDNSQLSPGHSDNISHQTRAGRPVRHPNKYKDFCKMKTL